MAGEGHALIFISHKLHEVMAISDRVTVLRDGRMAGTRPTADVTRDELAQMMVGREVRTLAPQPMQSRDVRLRIQRPARDGRPRHRGAARRRAWTCAAARSWASPASRATASASSRSAWPGCGR